MRKVIGFSSALFFFLALIALTFSYTAQFAASPVAAWSILDPFVSAISNIGQGLFPDLKAITCFVYAAAFFLFLFSIQPKFGLKLLASFGIVSLGFSVVSFLLGNFAQGGYALLVGALLILIGGRAGESPDFPPVRAFCRKDFLLLAVALILALGFRLYHLNILISYFEGELSPYLVGAMRWNTALLANEGVSGPWAPLGITYYVPLLITLNSFGVHVLSVRLASVIFSLVTLGFVYLLARQIGSRFGGFVAAAAFAMTGLEICWGRTDIHCHIATSWTALAILLAMNAWYERERIYLLLLIPLLQALAWHQYPSGQFAGILPTVVIMATCLVRLRVERRDLKLFAASLVGIVLWIFGSRFSRYIAGEELGPILDFFPRLGPRFYANALPTDSGFAGMLMPYWEHISHNAAVIGAALFHEFREPHIQEAIPVIPGIPRLAFEPVFLFFALIGLLLATTRFAKPRYSGLVSAFFLSFVACLLSDYAPPKRAAVAIPLLCVSMSVAVAWIEQNKGTVWRNCARIVIVGILALQASFNTFSWFRSGWEKEGLPYDENIVIWLREKMTPKALLLADISENYGAGKYSFMMQQLLIDPAFAGSLWYIRSADALSQEAFAQSPARSLADYRSRPYYYDLWSPVHDELQQNAQQCRWNKILYLVQKGEEPERYAQNVALLEKHYPNAAREKRIFADNPNAELTVFEVAGPIDLCKDGVPVS